MPRCCCRRQSCALSVLLQRTPRFQGELHADQVSGSLAWLLLFSRKPAAARAEEQERAHARKGGGEKSKRSDFSADSIVHDPGTTQASMNTHKKERERREKEKEEKKNTM